MDLGRHSALQSPSQASTLFVPGLRSARPLGRVRTRAAEDEADAEALLAAAARLREEAKAEEEALRATQKDRAVLEEGGSNLLELESEAKLIAEKLDAASAKLRRAEAFKLPDLQELRAEVSTLTQEATRIQKAIEDVKKPKEKAKCEEKKSCKTDSKGCGCKDGEEPARGEALSPGSYVPKIRTKIRMKNGDRLTEKDWEDLARRSLEMPINERFDLGMLIGAEGREYLNEIVQRLEKEQREKETQKEKEKMNR